MEVSGQPYASADLPRAKRARFPLCRGLQGPYAQVKVTDKAVPVHAMKAFRETRGKTQGARGGVIGVFH